MSGTYAVGQPYALHEQAWLTTKLASEVNRKPDLCLRCPIVLLKAC